MKNSIAYLVVPAIAWVIAQALKNVLNKDRVGTAGIAGRLRSGDMPSAHTAVVISLLTIIFIKEGVSALFALAFWFAAITIYDALVARRSIGEQGIALVRLLGKSAFAKDPLPRVAVGHKPLEVVAGAVIGAATALIVALFITI